MLFTPFSALLYYFVLAPAEALRNFFGGYLTGLFSAVIAFIVAMVGTALIQSSVKPIPFESLLLYFLLPTLVYFLCVSLVALTCKEGVLSNANLKPKTNAFIEKFCNVSDVQVTLNPFVFNDNNIPTSKDELDEIFSDMAEYFIPKKITLFIKFPHAYGRANSANIEILKRFVFSFNDFHVNDSLKQQKKSKEALIKNHQFEVLDLFWGSKKNEKECTLTSIYTDIGCATLNYLYSQLEPDKLSGFIKTQDDVLLLCHFKEITPLELLAKDGFSDDVKLIITEVLAI